MRFFDYIRMAFRNLWRRKLRSILTIFAVTIGSISMFSLLTLIFTASKAAVDQLNSIGAFTLVQISSQKKGVELFQSGGNAEQGKKLDDAVVSQIKNINHIVAVSPVSNIWSLQAVRLDGQDKKFNLYLNASEPNEATTKKIAAGRNLLPDEKNKIVLSGTYVKVFGFAASDAGKLIGKKVFLTTQPGYTGAGADVPKPPIFQDQDQNQKWNEEWQKKSYELPAEIVGIESPGPSSYDGGASITMAWAKDVMQSRYWKEDGEARKNLEMQGIRNPDQFPMILKTESEIEQKGYGSILAKVDNKDNMASVADAVKKMDLGAETAQDMIDQINNIFQIVGIILGAIGGIALFVATIGIVNTMIMATYERTREIGIMRACGATRGTIQRIFSIEAAFIGFLGGLSGVGVVYILAMIANKVGGQFFADQGIPLKISPPIFLTLAVVALTTIVGLLAGVGPAIRASRLKPVEALRYE